jgi:hypothetical protein
VCQVWAWPGCPVVLRISPIALGVSASPVRSPDVLIRRGAGGGRCVQAEAWVAAQVPALGCGYAHDAQLVLKILGSVGLVAGQPSERSVAGGQGLPVAACQRRVKTPAVCGARSVSSSRSSRVMGRDGWLIGGTDGSSDRTTMLGCPGKFEGRPWCDRGRCGRLAGAGDRVRRSATTG